MLLGSLTVPLMTSLYNVMGGDHRVHVGHKFTPGHNIIPTVLGLPADVDIQDYLTLLSHCQVYISS